MHHRPEGKLELIEDHLIVGSQLLLRQILQGWRAIAAITFAPIEILLLLKYESRRCG
ncbi:hypothetical protein [Leptolyngbya sp. FACHB-711]|uniref:hypothetical protein n=1 Tax=Leptolyngbya sp. FACHB-711 TaxID=2692813 RepID=UPI001A7E3288|nr:hypothetical protein [Leptolyngbya sp. FACHB-711]